MTRFLRCRFSGNDFTGERWMTTLDLYRSGSTWSSASPTELLNTATQLYQIFRDQVWTAATPGVKSYNRSQVGFDSAGFTQMLDRTVLGSYDYTGVNIVGTGTTVLPGSSAVVCSKRTDVSTRAGRGRAYLPLTAAALESTSGQIADADVDYIAARYAAFCAALNTTTFVLAGSGDTYTAAVVSGFATPGAALVPRDITRISVDSRVDRQVRRQRNAPSQHEAIVAV